MSNELSGRTVLFLVANEGIEQVELTRPWEAVVNAGGRPVLAAPESGHAQAFNHLDKGDTFPVDVTTSQIDLQQYDAVVLPGGVANPDRLRMDAAAVSFLRDFVAAGKPIAVICHGPWTLVEADVLEGRRITSWPSLQTDLRNAGAQWLDAEVVTCTGGANTLVSSRKPDDLDAFCRTFVQVFADGARSAA